MHPVDGSSILPRSTFAWYKSLKCESDSRTVHLGFEFDSGSRYIKTSAKIEHGSSGGVAIKDSGCVVGIPTFVEQGSVESIGRILDLHYLFNVILK